MMGKNQKNKMRKKELKKTGVRRLLEQIDDADEKSPATMLLKNIQAGKRQKKK